MYSNDIEYASPDGSKLPSNIRVRAATASDAEGLSDCFYVSFWPSHKFWTLTVPPKVFHPFWVDAFRMGIENDHSMRTFVATDEDTGGKIVGFMRWQVPQEDGKQELMWPDLPKEADMDVLGPFFGGMDKNRKELMGKRPHWFLQLLGTTTEYQGQGIGDCFVKWGCDLADKDDLEVYIDASEKGAPFYQKHFGAVPRADIPLPERPEGYGKFTYISHVVPKKSERGHVK